MTDSDKVSKCRELAHKLANVVQTLEQQDRLFMHRQVCSDTHIMSQIAVELIQIVGKEPEDAS